VRLFRTTAALRLIFQLENICFPHAEGNRPYGTMANEQKGDFCRKFVYVKVPVVGGKKAEDFAGFLILLLAAEKIILP
jgi:hypothetical protein